MTWNLPAFSTCGTDFPFDRLGWLARARVILGVLDADRAEQEAAERFGAALGARWRPLELPPGLDCWTSSVFIRSYRLLYSATSWDVRLAGSRLARTNDTELDWMDVAARAAWRKARCAAT